MKNKVIRVFRDNGDIAYCRRANESDHPQMELKIVNYLFDNGNIFTTELVGQKDIALTISENDV